ncbi:MAG: type IV pilus twitching motility protein PilT [Nitrospirae bacterium]|nr:type IV pilus twitching motility protein PilT [Nitrospirota bacterium]
MPRIDSFLKVMHQAGASDLHLGDGYAPILRIHGALEPTKHRVMSVEKVKILLYEMLSDRQIKELEDEGEIDFTYTMPEIARFRINMYRKHEGLGAAFRIIPNKIPTLDELGFPEALKKLLSQKSGLILVTGPTNSGKTTTLAAMVDYLNEHMNYHIITLEDPVEYIHANKNCLINQRQIGHHSRSFASALRSTLREDPNVILVGEMRDNETISLALTAAETGLLVLGTLHTRSAAQTVSRIMDVFPANQQDQVRMALSEVLAGTCCQQLVKRADGSGRVAALEIMIKTSAISNLIRESKLQQISNALVTGRQLGMQKLEHHLKELVSQKIITAEEAVLHAENPQEFMTARKEQPAETAPHKTS